jgi:kynureninase
MRLTGYLIELADAWLAPLGFRLASPRDAARRGAHICLHHPQAIQLNEALIEAGVIGDLRAPDRLRLGPAPITSHFTDVWDAADIIRRVAGGGEVTRSRRHPGEEIFPGGQP